MCILAHFLVFSNFWRMILFFCVNYISQYYYCELYMYVTIQEKNYRKYNGEKLFLFGLKHMSYWEISHFRQKEAVKYFQKFSKLLVIRCAESSSYVLTKNALITKIWKKLKNLSQIDVLSSPKCTGSPIYHAFHFKAVLILSKIKSFACESEVKKKFVVRWEEYWER